MKREEKRVKVTSVQLANFANTGRIGELSTGDVPNPNYPLSHALFQGPQRMVLGWS